MKNLFKAEILKLKNLWLLKLSTIVITIIPIITLIITLTNSQVEESKFLLLLRQNHIFFTLLICNIFFSLIAVSFFHMEIQYRTIENILSIPISKFKYILIKEIVLLFWIILLGISLFLVSTILGLIFFYNDFKIEMLFFSFWRYLVSAILSFLPIQVIVFSILIFRKYLFSLSLSVVALVGTIIAYNTTKIIFIYPFSIPFVLTNFVENISHENLIKSISVSIITAAICFAAMYKYFCNSDVKTN